jgi:hypothetical protein
MSTSASISSLIQKTKEDSKAAHNGMSHVADWVYGIGGFSPKFQRDLINNLCCGQEAYLEIGLFRGGTFCAAASGNDGVFCTGIEDFSQPFGEEGVKEDLINNIHRVNSEGGNALMCEEDCWSWAQDAPNDVFNVGFYDGNHSYDNQFQALQHFLHTMKKEFVWLVDDFSWDDVQRGTRDSLDLLQSKGKITQHFEMVWHVPQNEHPLYHNGIAVFVLEKK